MRDLYTKLFAAAAFLVAFGFAVFSAGCGSSGPDTTPPDMPSDFNLSQGNVGDGQIRIVWTGNREKDLDGYHVYRTESEPDNDYARIATVDQDCTTYLDTNLEYAIRYFYRISAYDNSGNESEWTDYVYAIPANLTPPDPPRNVTALGRNINDEPYIQLSWSPNIESDLKEYWVFRSTTQEVSTTGTPLAVVPRGTQSYRDDLESGQVGTRFYYKLIAVDRGDQTSFASQSATVSDVALSPPSLVSPADGATVSLRPTFTWTAVPEAGGYEIRVYSLIDPILSTIHWSTILDGNTTTSIQYPADAKDLTNATKYWWVVVTVTNSNDWINSASNAREMMTQ